MTEIYALDKAHPLWPKARSFARGSGWSAGPYLARMMEEEAYLPWERVFYLEEDGESAAYCNFRKDDELPQSWGFSPFIGFVYVEERFRGRRLSQKLLDAAVRYAGACGFEKVYLMSGEKGLYEKYGFRPMGYYETIFHTVDQLYWKATK